MIIPRENPTPVTPTAEYLHAALTLIRAGNPSLPILEMLISRALETI